MKKKGFTLAEILITLSIIGIASAIAAPYLTKAIPDKYKTRVLKNYQTISQVTDDLLANENLYYRKDPSTATSGDFNSDGTFKITTQYGCIGLNCKEMPYPITGYNTSDFMNICKYPNLMAASLAADTPTLCSTSNSFSKFKTSDGTDMKISAKGTTIAEGYTIEIDVDQTTNGKNCVYNKNAGCKNPDRFRFFVNSDGDIMADSSDPLTAVYLENMTRVDKKADFDAAYNK